MKQRYGIWNLRIAFAALSIVAISCISLAAVAIDSDGDGVDDSVDNCVWTPNPDQRDDDIDGQGFACDCDDTIANIDADGDGFGQECDCDDGDWLVYPGATEICNDGIDNDCDGGIDNCAVGQGVDSWSLIKTLFR